MPLVVPNTTADQRSDWAGKLLGKKLGDKHDEVTFAKQDLPQKHRVIQPDGMATADFDQNRYVSSRFFVLCFSVLGVIRRRSDRGRKQRRQPAGGGSEGGQKEACKRGERTSD